MPVTAASASLSQRFAEQLARRHAELRATLQAATDAAVGSGDRAGEVLDFKDVAAGDSQAAVDEAALAHAAQELRQVAAAMRRLDEGSYGFCQECGEAIDERRLHALPATPFCTACQTRHERPAGARR